MALQAEPQGWVGTVTMTSHAVDWSPWQDVVPMLDAFEVVQDGRTA